MIFTDEDLAKLFWTRPDPDQPQEVSNSAVVDCSLTVH